jgi:hypothetical protein
MSVPPASDVVKERTDMEEEVARLRVEYEQAAHDLDVARENRRPVHGFYSGLAASAILTACLWCLAIVGFLASLVWAFTHGPVNWGEAVR